MIGLNGLEQKEKETNSALKIEQFNLSVLSCKIILQINQGQ